MATALHITRLIARTAKVSGLNPKHLRLMLTSAGVDIEAFAYRKRPDGAVLIGGGGWVSLGSGKSFEAALSEVKDSIDFWEKNGRGFGR